MKLKPNWANIIRKAWSFRLGALAAVLSGTEAVLPFFSTRLPAGTFAIATFVIVMAALVARLMAQPKSGL